MADVNLVLKADNSEYVAKMREAQEASQKVYTTVAQGAKREKGLIEDIEEELTRLKKAKKEAYNTEDIAKYNRKIEEATFDLKEYDKMGLKSEKTNKGVMDSFAGMAAKAVTAAAAIKLVKDAVLATEAGLRAFNIVGQVTKQLMYDIVNGVGLNMSNIQGAISAAKEMDNLRIKQRTDMVAAARYQRAYNELYFAAVDRTKTHEERLKLLDKAMLAHNKMIDIEVEDVKEEIKITEGLLKLRPQDTKLLDQYTQALVKLEQVEGRRASETKRIEMQRTGFIQEEIEKQLKWRQDLHDALQQLADEEIEMNREAFEKNKKIIDAFYTWYFSKLQKAGEEMAKSKDYYMDLAYEIKTSELWDVESMIQNFMKAPVEIIPEHMKLKVNKELLELNKSLIEQNKNGGDVEPPDDFIQKLEKFKETASVIAGAIGDIYDQQAADAQRNREILDQRINETQQELEMEVRLYEAGYAANVGAKKKEVEDLKKQRDQALRDEEAARKRQQAIDTIEQVSSLVSASANIFKGFSKIPIAGPVLAVAAIAAMFTAFAAAKVNAKSVTKLALGGYGNDTGVITGRTHTQGGERLLDHVEVERGEAFGVLSRPATQKYGHIFREVVSSFNKDKMPTFDASGITTINRVRVDNDGPNSRLDAVINEQRKLTSEQRKLNEQLKTQITTVGGKTVIRSGNKTRIIGN